MSSRGLSIWGNLGGRAMLGMALVCVSGCAFALDYEPEQTPNSCSSDSDCRAYEACNPLSHACTLQPPPAEGMVIDGPFECTTESARWGGAALVAAWPSGYGIPAGTASLTHSCTSGLVENYHVSYMRGPRHFNTTLGSLGFYVFELYVARDRVLPGQTVGTDAAVGWLMFCPAEATPEDGSLDPENPWQSAAGMHRCLQLFETAGGGVQYETAGAYPGGEVRGFLYFGLNPSIVPPQ